ncbi:RNase LS family HEPN domain-containing protein [Mucilaginibacter sp. E4BP6]|uniref:RNase LS family HEPN domain-containing protein n=1 Tax=Mucilaginibacter sp. E4BP6 TaxID=2723089 RepID=UPI0015C91E96|nr:RNase LS family HEPN domain-containing protein [Mucilaginibacter sp. E4BP6]NYE65719.1 hypothetical protein [Mucilaginibacter sp. E4BP6]
MLLLGTQYKIEWKYGGSLFLNHYNSGSLQVQGSSIILKSIVIELLTELLPYKEVIEMQLKCYEADTTTDEVLIQLKHILPNAYSYLGETLIAILSPSIALKSLSINLTDYSAFAFPVLRGLEGYLKKLMSDNGITIESNANMGSFIETQSDKTVKVHEKITQQINNKDVIDAVEESYLYYKDKRHALFHIDGTINTTQILTKKQQAVEIIDEVFSIIETTYSKVLQNKK